MMNMKILNIHNQYTRTHCLSLFYHSSQASSNVFRQNQVTVCTIKSLTNSPSKRGTVWLCMKITPHWNAVNHRQVKRFGWYLRMTIGCGTGSKPTIVVLCRKVTTCCSSTPLGLLRERSSTLISPRKKLIHYNILTTKARFFRSYTWYQYYWYNISDQVIKSTYLRYEVLQQAHDSV